MKEAQHQGMLWIPAILALAALIWLAVFAAAVIKGQGRGPEEDFLFQLLDKLAEKEKRKRQKRAKATAGNIR